MHYRRTHIPGADYFFTVNLEDRRSSLLTDQIEVLKAVIRKVEDRHPFCIKAMVVMPDHLHTIWQMPRGDANFPLRWGLIKSGFSRRIEKTESVSESRRAKGERGIWQRRYWEHCIRDETDYRNHVDYIHYNPVKHGYVGRAAEWPHSSFHRFVDRGVLQEDWGASGLAVIGGYGER